MASESSFNVNWPPGAASWPTFVVKLSRSRVASPIAWPFSTAPDSPTFRHRTFRHQDTLTPPFLTPRHYDYKIFWHRDILTPRHFATQTLCHPDIVPLHTNQDILTPRHFAPKTFCHSSHLDTKTFWQFPSSGLTNPPPPPKKKSCWKVHSAWDPL